MKFSGIYYTSELPGVALVYISNGIFLRETATHQAERYKKHPPWSVDSNGMQFISVKLVVLADTPDNLKNKDSHIS